MDYTQYLSSGPDARHHRRSLDDSYSARPDAGWAAQFQDLQNSLSRISPNTLSARLKTLEEHGIIERRFYADHPPRADYVLTARGSELRPVLRALRVWGEKAPRRPAGPRRG